MGLLDSLYGQGDYADAGMILPYAITPEGERVLSFPAPVQAAARTVGRAMGDLPLDIDPSTGLLSEDVLMDAFDLSSMFTGAGLLAPRPAGSIGMGGYEPQKTVKAYKLFKTDKKGNLYPLFVKMRGNEPIPVGEWTKATAGEINPKTGKVKSSLGDLAYRPGFHAGDAPSAKHIGGKIDPETGKPTRKGSAPNVRKENQVWAEVEYPADVDWQSIADERAVITKAGTPNLATAHITDEVPYGGFYRYKTNPNMEGNWLISGDMKVNKILTDKEVKAINKKAGTSDLPRAEELVRKYLKSRGLLEM
jgi:hypothetical protein